MKVPQHSISSKSNITVEIWTPTLAPARNPSSERRVSGSFNRSLVLAAVLAGHALVLWIATMGHVSMRSEPIKSTPPLVAHIYKEMKAADAQSIPEMLLAPVLVDIPVPDITNLAEAGQSAEGSTPPFSAPRVDPRAPVDVTPYALKAGLSPGSKTAVVLAVDVLPDGSVGEVIVETSGGSAAIDAAAIEYARTRHWIPGTSQGKLIKMRVRYRVNFSIASSFLRNRITPTPTS